MKLFSFFFCILLISCHNTEKISVDSIIYKGGNVTYDLTKNQFYLNNDYNEVGNHNLNLSKTEIDLIKQKIVKEKIFLLKDRVSFIKQCREGGCLSEIIIKYKNNKLQHFIFDNYLYKDGFDNEEYRKIAELDEIISKIILTKKINLETKYDRID